LIKNNYKTLLLIDANSIIHRCFHALPPFTTSKKEPIGAIYGMANIFLKLWENRPNFAAALFDRPEPTFRKKEYEDYKAQRPVTPDELISQIVEAHNFFQKFGIKTFEIPGFEADDLIATLVNKFKNEKNLKIIILTGDRDTLQLVEDDKIVVEAFKKGISETIIYNYDTVKNQYGLEPSQLIDYKAMVGDPSDNIRGVPGIGPKTAVDLLQKYGTLENIFFHSNEDPKIEKKLAPFKAEAELARRLVILNKEAPLEIKDIKELETSEPNVEEYFRTLGFKAILKRMRKNTKETAELDKKENQKSLFSD
jgi:DNA polymerase-1